MPDATPPEPPPSWPAPRPAERAAAGESAADRAIAASGPHAPEGRAAWSPWLSALALVTGIGVTMVVGLLVFLVTTSAGVDEDAPGIGIGLTLVQNVALVGAAFYFAAIGRGGLAATDFGLRRPRFWRSVGLLVAVWIGFVILSAAYAALVELDERQQLPQDLGAEDSVFNALLVVFLVTVIAPLGEEIFFRGFFFGALRNWRGLWPAAILTGIVFGGIHLGSSPVEYVPPLMIFGAALCLLYHWTGSLYPAIALHALNNSIALGTNLDWDWQIPVMMVASTAVALLCGWLLARVVGDRRRSPPPAAPAPGGA